MAKRTAMEAYPLIPEGENILRIKEIDDSKYKDFDKLTVIYEDAGGLQCRENFNFLKNDGTPNPMADIAFTKLGRFALNDQTLDEIDTDDLPGRYIRAEIVHKPGEKGGTFVNINSYLGPADGFDRKTTAAEPPAKKKTPAEILAAAKAKKAKAGA